ncbi:hydrogenase nickel incorporation protein HypB [Nocardia aurantiaca]|uniref:Hydrogenase nickel incorporation protein HypB n=1 Tax=Nocardia aurantiaca TaxID=2675850 RepID=A0A6I3L7L3_9NOCA|nr:hydrogenase nickel incorporation protein HypB [Nocardia aurantiaca]MTE16704.1 hydrogenase nickel incorporation protein HypB [Nocardia aurantiaca]
MCATCGCGDAGAAVITVVPQHHSHDHDHPHPHEGESGEHTHGHGPGEHVHLAPTETVTLEQKVLAKNDALAQSVRRTLAERSILAINLTSSPGSGKTTLLERTLRELADTPIAVIEGDQETMLDGERIRATGRPVVQVNTGAGCHLDATMMDRALTALSPAPGTLLFIENVGNLVCPALFDLGEHAKVVVISVTEGTDKPLKYPHMFAAASLVLINKMDLLPYVDFDLEACREYANSVNPGITVLTVSANTGAGMPQWYEWLSKQTSALFSTLEEGQRRA